MSDYENFGRGAVPIIGFATSALDAALGAIKDKKYEDARASVEAAKDMLGQLVQQADRLNEAQAARG
jgi:hypothetical protein